MEERDVPKPPDEPDETDDPDFRDTPGHTPGGAEPLGGGGEDDNESQNADIPAAG